MTYSVRTESRRPWLVHVTVTCNDCGGKDLEANYHNDYVGIAREHVRKTGHRVTVETGYAQVYMRGERQ